MWALAVLLAAAPLVVGGCSGSEQSPADARRERVESNLRATFSAAQARCIVDRAQGDVLEALDREQDLPASSDDLRAYSDLLVACVMDPEGTTTTTASTTTAPPPDTATTSTPP